MADNQQEIVKPTLPNGYTKWWALKMSELTPEQAELKRDYLRQYHLWKKSQKPPSPLKETKLPAGVGKWWNKPVAELTEEQREIRNKYEREHKRKQFLNNPTIKEKASIATSKMWEDAKKYRELVKNGVIKI